MSADTPFPNAFRRAVLARQWRIGCRSALGSPVSTEVLGLAGFVVALGFRARPNDVLSLVPQLMALKDSPSAPVVRPAQTTRCC